MYIYTSAYTFKVFSFYTIFGRCSKIYKKLNSLHPLMGAHTTYKEIVIHTYISNHTYTMEHDFKIIDN